MKIHIPLTFAVLLLPLTTNAQETERQIRINIAEDEAWDDGYNHGWIDKSSGGKGFGPWTLIAPTYSQDTRYSGFFIANKDSNPTLNGIGERAFGMFANGHGFEECVAYRKLNHRLRDGDTFSLFMEFDGFNTKFGSDTLRPGKVGFALLTDAEKDDVRAYDKDARFVFEAVQGKAHYVVVDSEATFDTGIPIDPKGVMVAVTLRGRYLYDLQVKTMSDGVVHEFDNRRLAGDRRDKISGFSLFNLNSEESDVFFGGLQVARPLTTEPASS